MDTLNPDPVLHARLFLEVFLRDLEVNRALPIDLSTPESTKREVAAVESVLEKLDSCRIRLAAVRTLLGMPQDRRPTSSGRPPGASRRFPRQ